MRLTACHAWLGALALQGLACGPSTQTEGSTGGSSSGSSTGPHSMASTSTGASTSGSSADVGSGPAVDSSGSAESGGLPPEPSCGDGVVDPLEECDDGNEVEDDACNDDCVATASIIWTATLDENGCAHAVAVAASGEIAVGGSVSAGVQGINAWVGMLDSEGALQWSQDWDGGVQEPDEVVALALDDAASIHLAVTEDDGTENAWLYKIGLDGSAIWSVALERPPEHTHYAKDVVVGPDGEATLLAVDYGPGPDGLLLQRFSLAGVPVWPSAVALDDDVETLADPSLGLDGGGDLYVVGVRGPGTWHAFLQRHAWLDGAVQWSVGSNPPLDQPSDRPVIGSTRQDGVSALVLFDAFAPEDLVVRSWDASGVGPEVSVPGVVLKDLRLNDATHDGAGNLLIAASDASSGWVFKLDPAGARIWSRASSGPGDESGDVEAVAVAANDDVIAAGCVRAGGTVHPWVRRYAP